MTLQEMIEQGRNITNETPEYYFWVGNVERYLNGLPNKSYLDQARAAINDCKEHGENSILRKRGTFKIVAVLMRIYDNEQEKFLQDNVTTPLLSIFEDNRMRYAKQEFEDALQHLNEGRYKQSITWACKAVESTMQAVCLYKDNSLNVNVPFGTLVGMLNNLGIITVNGMLDGHATMRNKTSAHGTNDRTYEPIKEDAVFEINRGAALMIYLYEKSGIRDNT